MVTMSICMHSLLYNKLDKYRIRRIWSLVGMKLSWHEGLAKRSCSCTSFFGIHLISNRFKHVFHIVRSNGCPCNHKVHPESTHMRIFYSSHCLRKIRHLEQSISKTFILQSISCKWLPWSGGSLSYFRTLDENKYRIHFKVETFKSQNTFL